MEEISSENLGELKERYRTTVFIVFALIFASIFLILAAWMMTMNRTVPASEDSFLTLWLVILFLAAGTFLLRRRLFNWETLKNAALLKGVSGLLKKLQFNVIFLNSIAVAVVILGFVISYLSGEFMDVIRTALVALIVFFINFPRRSVWEKIIRHLERV